MKKINKLISKVLVSFALVGVFSGGILLNSKTLNHSTLANTQDYDNVTNQLPQFFNIGNNNDENNTYVTEGLTADKSLFLVTPNGQIKTSIANDIKTKTSTTMPDTEPSESNYVYYPSQDNKSEYMYFNFTSSMSLYYNLTNADDFSQGTNLLAGQDITKYVQSHTQSFLPSGYDFTPKKFNMDFSLNTALAAPAFGVDELKSQITLDKEGCYTLVIPYVSYHTNNDGIAFSTESGTINYSFMLFNSNTYLNPANNLPNINVETAKASTLVNSLTHSKYYFYNFTSSAILEGERISSLPAINFNPNLYELVVTYVDSADKATKYDLTFDGTKIIFKDAAGKEMDSNIYQNTYDPASKQIGLIFNDIGYYNIEFNFIYKSGEKTFNLPLKTLNQRLYMYGYNASYTDYNQTDSVTETTISKELKNILPETKSFDNSADITGLINNGSQTPTSTDPAYLLDNATLLKAINDNKINPVSTNQTPIKFKSSTKVSLSDKSKFFKMTQTEEGKWAFDGNSTPFKGENINSPGTYLIFASYNYGDYMSANGTVQSNYYHHQVFFLTVKNTTPTVSVINTKGNEIFSKGYTNQSVYIIDDSSASLYDADVEIKLSAFNYTTKRYFFESINITELNKYEGIKYKTDLGVGADQSLASKLSGKAGVYIDKTSPYSNAQWTIEIISSNSKLPSKRSFTIDTSAVTNLRARNVAFANSSTYVITQSVDNNITNQPVIFSWNEKTSGVGTHGYYRYYPLNNIKYYSGNDSLLLFDLIGENGEGVLPVEAQLNLDSSKNSWTSYSNTTEFSNSLPATYARSDAGLYVFEVFDDAGNYGFEVFMIDNTSPLFVKNTIDSEGSQSRKILTATETITVSDETDVSIEWGKFKGIHIANYGRVDIMDGLYKNYEYDNLSFDGENPLKEAIDSFFARYVKTITNISAAPPEGSIDSYSGAYLTFSIIEDSYIKEAISDNYVKFTTNSYKINFFDDQNQAVEGAYKFLIRDESNNKFAHNNYGFLNSPSNFITIIITSDASQLKFIVNDNDDNVITAAGYNYSGKFYQKSEDNGDITLSYNNDSNTTLSDKGFKFSYYSPIKTSSKLSLSYIPTPKDSSQVANITLQYYPFVKTYVKNTMTGHDKVPFDYYSYYYDIAREPSRNIVIYQNNSPTEVDKVMSYSLAFSEDNITAPGKYVITRRYSLNDASGTANKYDYFERVLTLNVDRYNVISAQETIESYKNEPVLDDEGNPTYDLDGNPIMQQVSDEVALESIVGGDILLTMFSNNGKYENGKNPMSEIAVSFPKYNPNTGLNDGSFYTSGSMSESTQPSISVSSNKLPLKLNIPTFKYTLNNDYNYQNNSYSVNVNTNLSYFGNLTIRFKTREGNVESEWQNSMPEEKPNVDIIYGVFTGEVLINNQTYALLAEAEAALEQQMNKAVLSEYKLSALVEFTDSNHNVTYYKTSSSHVGNYLNLYKVASKDADPSTGEKVDSFSRAGTYVVTIYQASNQATGGEEFNNFKNFYKFSFAVTAPKPNFDVLNADGIELNNVVSNGRTTYYTNSKTIKLRWQDSNSEYIANIDQSKINILLNGTTKYDVTGKIVTDKLVNTLTIDLSSIWKAGGFVNVKMQLVGLDSSVIEKDIIIDYSAPVNNLVSLMDKTEQTSSIFNRVYQEKNMRSLYDIDEKQIDTSSWRNTSGMVNVSYTYSIGAGYFKYYSYMVTKDFFKNAFNNISSNTDHTATTNMWFSQIADLNQYNQTTNGSFSPLDTKYIPIDRFEEIETGYYEVIETDYAGNMVVYVISLIESDISNKTALSYTNDRIATADDETARTKTITNKQINDGLTIYSNSGFELLTLNYMDDSWALYNITINGIASLYMSSPYLEGQVYKITSSSSGISLNAVNLSTLFEKADKSKIKQQISFSDRLTGSKKTTQVAIMDESLQINKIIDPQNGKIAIATPTAENIAGPYAFTFPRKIEVYNFDTLQNKWVSVANLENNTLNPASPENWTKNEFCTLEYSAVTGFLTLTVKSTGSTKFKYIVTDNFDNQSTVIQLVNEQVYNEIESTDDYYTVSEYDNSITYLTSNNIDYQYNKLLYDVEVVKVIKNGAVVDEKPNASPIGTNSNIYRFRFTIGSANNYDYIYQLVVKDTETKQLVKNVNIKIYNRLPIYTDVKNGNSNEQNIWLLDKYNNAIKNNGIIRNVKVVKGDKTYITNATSVSTYSSNVTVYFNDGQFLNSASEYVYESQLPYSVYFSMDGKNWENINESYANGFKISGTGTYYVLATYDNADYFQNACKLIQIQILDSSSVYYYITVDGNIANKADMKYTDKNGKEYSDNYIVSVNYNDKEDRIQVLPNNELNVELSLPRVETTATNVRVEIYEYISPTSLGSFTIIYIDETSVILTQLTYDDATGSSVSLFGSANPAPIVASEDESGYNRLKLTWTSYYGIPENKVNIEVLKYFNKSYVPVEVKSYTSAATDTNYAYLTRSGTYKIRFYDSCTPANNHMFGNSQYINIIFLNSVPFTITYTDPVSKEEIVTEPISHSVYNGTVKLSLVELATYFQTSGYPEIKVLKNGKEYNAKATNYVYSFTEAGYYELMFSATSTSGIKIRQEKFVFTILNSSESRFAYEFAPYSTYYIEKVVKDGVDVTDKYLNILGLPTVNVNGKDYLNSLLVSYFDEKTGTGKYVVTINTGESVYKNLTATSFSFEFRINLATPPLNISLGEGDSTTKDITVSFNTINLHNAIGDCYIRIGNATYYITSETLGDYAENAILPPLSTNGTYYIQLYTISGNLLFSYKVIKNAAMNVWTIIAIVIAVIIVSIVVFITIKLRKRQKVK